MTPRRRALGTALVLLCLPLAVALAEVVTFQVRNRNNRSLVSGGKEREYLLHVPASYDPGRSTPLVISMHGAGGWPVQQRDISGWNAVAVRQPCISDIIIVITHITSLLKLTFT